MAARASSSMVGIVPPSGRGRTGGAHARAGSRTAAGRHGQHRPGRRPPLRRDGSLEHGRRRASGAAAAGRGSRGALAPESPAVRDLSACSIQDFLCLEHYSGRSILCHRIRGRSFRRNVPPVFPWCSRGGRGRAARVGRQRLRRCERGPAATISGRRDVERPGVRRQGLATDLAATSATGSPSVPAAIQRSTRGRCRRRPCGRSRSGRGRRAGARARPAAAPPAARGRAET